MDYIKQYPEYTSKSSFKKLLDKIEQKEKEIREAKKEYNDSVSKYNYYLSFFEKHLQKAEDKASAYKTVLAEGKEVLNESRYKKSIAYKFAPEEVKAEVNIDTLSHDFNKVKNTLQISKKEFAKNQTKEFVEMEY